MIAANAVAEVDRIVVPAKYFDEPYIVENVITDMVWYEEDTRE